MGHDDVEITESVINDSIVVGSHLTENVAREAPPIVVCQEDIGEANNSDIGPRRGVVSSKQTQTLDEINSPFQVKDPTISFNIAHLNYQALLDTGAAVAALSARVWQECVSDITLDLDPPNHDSITTVDGYSLKVLGKVMLPFAIRSKIFPCEAHMIPDSTFDVVLRRNFFQNICATIDFDEDVIQFKHGNNLLPFDDFDLLAVDSGDFVALNLFVLCMLTCLSPFHQNEKS